MAAGAETARYVFEKEFVHNPEQGNPLVNEMINIRANWWREGLTSNWHDLPDTGFMINTQLGLLSSEIETVNHQLQREKIQHWLEKTQADLRGFTIEYLAEGLVFPIYYTIENVDGTPCIINTLHGQRKKLSETVSKKERNGAVWQTFVEVVEPFLLNAKDGSIAVVDSPAGPSGMYDESGKHIVYPDSQTYILQKIGDRIKGFTIRTDFNLQEHQELLTRLRRYAGMSKPESNQLEDYTTNAALFDHGTMSFGVEDIVNIMRQVRFDQTQGSLCAYKQRLWQEVYKDIRRGDRLWKYDDTTEKYIKDFTNFVLTKNWSWRALKEALATTVLRIARFVRGNKTNVGQEYLMRKGLNMPLYRYISYGSVLEDIQALEGCAGGGVGKKRRLLFESVTARFGEYFEDGLGSEGENCALCGAKEERLGPCRVCAACEGR